ncbi:basic-leucine zipper transcription factor A [Lucilia sericata]|uniref:basic-leucine zipper transcription factor A n=1 Tax=Lucilia sericata TaxID=13632 RepID=UPI0018A8164D|nr:basic-leucine zipper transcription factor A [Lucilia sericata]XP_037824671.1 basic-leucine zipper transcription factor A [Lucilia sericata]
MSAVTNTHKINGNLIVSANTPTSNISNTTTAGTITTTTSTNITHSKSLTPNPHRNQTHHHSYQQEQEQQQQQLQKSYNNLQAAQQQHSSKLSTVTTKLQAPQQHQKRSLIPSVALQQQQQQHQQQSQTISILNTTSTTATVPTQANQLQTIATIHQPSSQAQQRNAPSTLTESNNTTAGGVSENPITRRNFYHLQTLKTAGNSLKAPAHSIPPRYQPPPQPQSQSNPTTGILKNLNTQRLSSGAKTAYPSYFSTETTGNHLNNLKYPPDIPQLSSVFIPDSLKNPTNSSRYSLQQQRQQQQQQQNNHQAQLQQRLRSINQTTTNGHSTQQLSTAEQQQQQHQDMLKFVRKPDQDHPSPNASVTSSGTGGGIPPAAGRLTAEQNRQLQSLINELRSLKEQNQRLMDDNQELRDLCCFLDDDRQKGRKLAREWQRFGRYTASVMRQEVAAYQNKLRQLDDKQQELITDNLELKELCLYLDEERAHIAANSICVNCGASTRNTLRDDGDGSSSSTNADENMTALRNYESQLPDLHLRSTLQDQTLQYVRSLERRIQQLEKERNDTNVTSKTPTPTANILSPQQQRRQIQAPQQQTPSAHLSACLTAATSNTHNQKAPQPTSALNDALVDPISGRPEAVVRALQVLEVREQLERDRLGNLTGQTIDQMDDGEKALVREMCNVVWRKLEGSPNGPTALETL